MHKGTKGAAEGVEAPARSGDGIHVERYNLLTALCLIIGICIGSGIFFKSDNILVATGGNVTLGVIMFFLAATTIVFGGLTLARFAAKTDGHGGAIAYAERFLGPRWLTFIGWHYTFLYVPLVTAVVCWVVGVYACMSFGLPDSFSLQILIGAVFLVLCTGWNVVWPTLSGHLQNVTTIAKALPLVVVAVIGFALGEPGAQLSHGLSQASGAGTGWLAAAAPIAFAFDGWSSAAGIAPELKNAKRNLPLALVIGPIIILVLYLGYFVGISCYLGPQTVMEAGDASLSLMFTKLFGPGAAAIPNVIALVAVVGTANGMVLASLRMPFALALHDQIPFSATVRKVNSTLRFPVVSAGIAFATTLGWLLLHALVTTLGLLPNGDISEIGVAMTLLILPIFYVQALRIGPMDGAEGTGVRVRSAVAPVIATVSSLAIGLSGLSDPTRWPFVAAYAAIAAAIMFTRRPR